MSEDRALRKERADADEIILAERVEHVAILALERAETDKDLLIERARTDSALELRFSVSDSGPGIPAENLESVFERYVQVSKDDRRGLGLGLYISKCIVQGHGGRIWAESTIGKGSTFFFTLPLTA